MLVGTYGRAGTPRDAGVTTHIPDLPLIATGWASARQPEEVKALLSGVRIRLPKRQLNIPQKEKVGNQARVTEINTKDGLSWPG